MAPKRKVASGMPTEGQNSLAAYVREVMKANNLRPMDVHRLTDINRTTLTLILKGEYPLASERTRPTLRKLADGLGLSRDSVMLAAHLEPEPEVVEEEEPTDNAVVLAELRRLAARLEAAGLLDPEPPDDPSSGPGALRRRLPRGGRPGNPRKGSQDK